MSQKLGALRATRTWQRTKTTQDGKKKPERKALYYGSKTPRQKPRPAEHGSGLRGTTKAEEGKPGQIGKVPPPIKRPLRNITGVKRGRPFKKVRSREFTLSRKG